MRINLGFKAWAGLSAMVLSVAVVSGCNEEGSAPTTNPTPAPGPAAGGAPAKKPDTTTPPPPTTPKEEKAPEKK